jgi:hypothetical protein
MPGYFEGAGTARIDLRDLYFGYSKDALCSSTEDCIWCLYYFLFSF